MTHQATQHQVNANRNDRGVFDGLDVIGQPLSDGFVPASPVGIKKGLLLLGQWLCGRKVGNILEKLFRRHLDPIGNGEQRVQSHVFNLPAFQLHQVFAGRFDLPCERGYVPAALIKSFGKVINDSLVALFHVKNISLIGTNRE